MLGIISPGVQALNKIGEYASVEGLPGQIKAFRIQVETVILELMQMPKSLNKAISGGGDGPASLTHGAEKGGLMSMMDPFIALFVGLKPAFEAMKKMLDDMKELAKFGDTEKQTSTTAGLDFFGEMLIDLVDSMGSTADLLEGEGVATANRFFAVCDAISSSVRGGMDLLSTMGEAGVRAVPGMLADWAAVMTVANSDPSDYAPVTTGAGNVPNQSSQPMILNIYGFDGERIATIEREIDALQETDIHLGELAAANSGM